MTEAKSVAKKKPTAALDERKAARELMNTADDVLAAMEESDFCKEHSVQRHYPLFAASEIATGPVLGVGGFGIVFEVEEIILKDQKDKETPQPEQVAADLDVAPLRIDEAAKAIGEHMVEQEHYEVSTARAFMAANVQRNGTDARYALKILRHDLSELERTRGMIDMAIETKLLSRLWHPNIGTYRSCYFVDLDKQHLQSRLTGLYFSIVPDRLQSR
jgi:hypothetical protein